MINKDMSRLPYLNQRINQRDKSEERKQNDERSPDMKNLDKLIEKMEKNNKKFHNKVLRRKIGV
jgi:hypothetical protein